MVRPTVSGLPKWIQRRFGRNIVAAPVSIGQVPPIGDEFMPVSRSTFLRPLLVATVVIASSLSAMAQQSPDPSRVRGTVEAVDGDLLAVKSRGGEDFKLHMSSNMLVVGITKISLADIKPGSFIGTTTVPGPDGGAKAIEVHVFPENMRGTGEGSRPFDLHPNSTMTNATVAETVVSNEGHVLTIKYKGGEKTVVVSPETPVVTYVPGDRSELKPGAKVIAFIKKQPNGSFEADRVSVGRDGLTPPM
jgi:hypothetical protein